MYPLFAFTDGNTIIISRGENERQVMRHLAQTCAFPRGATFWPMSYLFMSSAKEYSRNHQFDWLNIPPLYIQDS